MKPPLCPICQSKTSPFFAKNLHLFRCFSCSLIFQFLHPSEAKFHLRGRKPRGEPERRGANTPSWGFSDPRFSEATYQMKKQTFRNLFKEISESFREDKTFKAGGRSEGSVECPQRTASDAASEDIGRDELLTGPASTKGLPTSADKKRLLDIGTGTGTLLEVAAEFGFKATGLEPDKKFFQKAEERGLKVLNYTLEKSNFKPNSFDIITMFDVLEHMHDLNPTLKKISLILKPGGLLVISTPNTNSLSFKLMGPYWPHFKKEHIYYFSPKSLSLLLHKFSFVPLTTHNSTKSLNINYINGYFTAFPTPILSLFSKLLVRLLPKSLTELPINLPNGNMLVIAKKSLK